jgi:hypothetical protein
MEAYSDDRALGRTLTEAPPAAVGQSVRSRFLAGIAVVRCRRRSLREKPFGLDLKRRWVVGHESRVGFSEHDVPATVAALGPWPVVASHGKVGDIPQRLFFCRTAPALARVVCVDRLRPPRRRRSFSLPAWKRLQLKPQLPR